MVSQIFLANFKLIFVQVLEVTHYTKKPFEKFSQIWRYWRIIDHHAKNFMIKV